MRAPAFQFLIVIASLFVFLAAKSAMGANPAPAFDPLKIIMNRNIFDSTRQPQARPRERRRAVVTPERLTLRGVFLNGDEAVAFFDGSRSNFSRSVRLGDRIAGTRVIEIQTDKVRLDLKGNTIELPVSGQLERLGENPWTVSARTSPPSESIKKSEDRAESTDKQTSSTATSSSGGASDDLVKRLMERRRKEMGK